MRGRDVDVTWTELNMRLFGPESAERPECTAQSGQGGGGRTGELYFNHSLLSQIYLGINHCLPQMGVLSLVLGTDVRLGQA